VCALLYAGYLMGGEIPELKQLQSLFTAKYGKEYAQEVINNKEKYLDHRLLKMLTSTQVPDPSVVNLYLTEIAKAYNVEYMPRPQTMPQGLMSSTVGVRLPLPGSAIPQPINPDDLEPPSSAPAGPAAVPVSGQIPVASYVPQAIHMPVASPVAATAPSMPTPFTVVLSKASTGFGLTLDAHNVVTGVKPGTEAERIGAIQVGDLVLALNGQGVTDDHPVKTIAIDMPEGAAGTFVILRRNLAPSGSPSAPAIATAVPAVATQPATGFGMPVPPAPPAQPVVSYPPVVEAQPTVQMPPVQPTPAQPPPADASDDPDDALARRLEALKRS